jgi:hypothetical protein
VKFNKPRENKGPTDLVISAPKDGWIGRESKLIWFGNLFTKLLISGQLNESCGTGFSSYMGVELW